MYICRFIVFFICILLNIFLGTCAFANSVYRDNDSPIKVNSNNMVYNLDKNTVLFTGKVVVERGGFVMTSDRMEVFMLDEKNKTSAQKSGVAGDNKIDRIEAYGNVEFDYGTQSGSSKTAVYEADQSLLTLRGDPIVRDKGNFIKGNVIKYYMDERRSEVIGSEGKQVEAVFSGN